MSKQTPFLQVKDHSVSGERFQLILNEELHMLETSPRPKDSELPKYYKSEDYISHTSSKRNLFELSYHLVRGITLKRKLKLINSFGFEEKKILDVGCGTGNFLEYVLKSGWKVIGVEPNDSARKIANSKTSNCVFEINKLSELKENSFDVITLWHVLEHLPKLEDHIALLIKLLKPNGKLIIAVPNYNSFDAKYYREFWAAYDVPRHLWHFSQTSMDKLFSKKAMLIEKTLPMKFDAYYVSMLSEKYKKSFLGFLKGLLVGFKSNLKAKRTGEYSSLIYIIKNVN